LERVTENEIASCVKQVDTQDYESAVFNYLSICYYIKFEHICQDFGFELSLVDTIHMPNCSSEPFGVFFVLRHNI